MLSLKHHTKLSWLGLISTLSVVALLCFQFYWLYNGYKSTYSQLVDNAREALKEACEQEQEIRKKAMGNRSDMMTSSVSIDSMMLNTNIPMKMTYLYYHSGMSFTDINVLDSLYKQTLAEKGLSTDYILEIKRPGEEVQQTGIRRSGHEILIELPQTVSQVISINDAEAFNVNVNKEKIAAYISFTPFVVFRQMAWTLVASVLLFFIILYCLLTQLQVIRRQKTAAKMKNDFIANFTHELKTPIAVVYVALDNIERNPEKSQAAVEVGKTQLKRLSDSVEKILSLSVGEQERLTLHREEIYLKEWIPTLVAPFRLKEEKEISFDLLFDPPEISVYADKVHLAHALNNIIDNAIKYSGSKVHVAISCVRHNAFVRIAVRDNGPGIAPEDLKNIFVRFYRAKSVADTTKGFGLGLNYAQSIAELHGGKLTAESEWGKGSVFMIELPV